MSWWCWAIIIWVFIVAPAANMWKVKKDNEFK